MKTNTHLKQLAYGSRTLAAALGLWIALHLSIAWSQEESAEPTDHAISENVSGSPGGFRPDTLRYQVRRSGGPLGSQIADEYARPSTDLVVGREGVFVWREPDGLWTIQRQGSEIREVVVTLESNGPVVMEQATPGFSVAKGQTAGEITITESCTGSLGVAQIRLGSESARLRVDIVGSQIAKQYRCGRTEVIAYGDWFELPSISLAASEYRVPDRLTSPDGEAHSGGNSAAPIDSNR